MFSCVTVILTVDHLWATLMHMPILAVTPYLTRSRETLQVSTLITTCMDKPSTKLREESIWQISILTSDRAMILTASDMTKCRLDLLIEFCLFLIPKKKEGDRVYCVCITHQKAELWPVVDEVPVSVNGIRLRQVLGDQSHDPWHL